MHRTKVFILAVALCLCAVLTAAALTDGTLKTLWNSGCDFLFHTDNVTVTGQATFSLDGKRFKTAELNYVQDGYKSYYGLKLLTPWSDGTEHETGWTIIAAADGTITVMEAFKPGVYNWATGTPQNTLLRRTVRLDALTDLGGLMAASVDALLPEGAVTVTEADGTKTVHIALTEGQIPDQAVSVLNLAADYLAARWFNGYDRSITEQEALVFDQYVTVTEALTGGTVRWVLKNVDVDFALDAQGRLSAARGAVKVASEYWDGTVREVEAQFEFAATDYGTSTVKPFDPADYGVVSGALLPAEEEPQGMEPATDYVWMDENFGQATGAVLPAYAYTGGDPIEAAVAAYAAETMGSRYLLPQGAASIPAPVILKTVAQDENTALVYGNFWVMNYVLRGTVLECVSGGEAPGVMTLTKSGDGWTVTAFEEAGDGDDYAKDIQRFCQGDKELEKAYFAAADVSEDPLKSVRQRFIQDYVTVGKLAVRAYQDYGWEPKALIPGSEPKIVTAIASEINPEHLESVAAYARITAADENKLTVELLTPERFDREEVLSLVPGDAIYTQGQEIKVETVKEQYGYVILNEGEYEFSEGSVWLYEETDGTFAVAAWDDIAWTALPEAAFPVTDKLLFLDGINPSSGEMLDMPTVHSGAEFLEMLKKEAAGEGPGFDVNNVFVVFDADGQLELVQRYYVPWQ
ncbi:MAG: hypothetical protein IJQ62_10670 [Clostridia bacterium]|nr:hypothetical protein [Clostridia bacterium]